MADIITTLHANKRPDLILFPQIKADNIPAEAISYDKPTTLLKYIMIDGSIYEI